MIGEKLRKKCDSFSRTKIIVHFPPAAHATTSVDRRQSFSFCNGQVSSGCIINVLILSDQLIDLRKHKWLHTFDLNKLARSYDWKHFHFHWSPSITITAMNIQLEKKNDEEDDEEKEEKSAKPHSTDNCFYLSSNQCCDTVPAIQLIWLQIL